ncbi:hypothetical protein FA95DRAFT_1496161 [Auriscalpium vulgare]|uniref:Uncharacterized protein n=1 Tax=Auriscalpium vulgare TaxID=40419 RepID=A0ACB8RLR6_9AGAM|nr:hypothetical protein FA95DRAFT_1496161 [Auriscalpium vulgare]
MGSHFCCCLPLRFGVIIISAFQTLSFALTAAVTWYHVAGHWLDDRMKRIALLFALYYSAATLGAILGFFGAISRSFQGIQVYFNYMMGAFLISLVLDGVALWGVFGMKRDAFEKGCINGSTDQTVIDDCNKKSFFREGKIAFSVIIVLSIIVQLWALGIVSRYGDKLEAEQAWRANAPDVVPMVGETTPKYGGYASASRTSMEGEPLTGPNYTYPYADAQHSYGQGPYDPPQPPAAAQY